MASRIVIQIIVDGNGPLGPDEMAEAFETALHKQGERSATARGEYFDDQFGSPVVCYIP